MDDVWYVDDTGSFRRLMQDLIPKSGHQVRFFSDGAEAYAALQRGEKPKLLVTDHDMPVMKGLELIAAARKMHPDLRMILLSSLDLKIEAEALGAAYLQKPFLHAAFITLVNDWYPKE